MFVEFEAVLIGSVGPTSIVERKIEEDIYKELEQKSGKSPSGTFSIDVLSMA